MKKASIIITALLAGYLIFSGAVFFQDNTLNELSVHGVNVANAGVFDDDDNGDNDDNKEPAEINVKIKNPLKAKTLEDVINNLIDFVFFLALIICPLVIIIGGFIFVTAGGDPKKIESGKKMIYYALIGLGIVILAKGFVMALKAILGVKKTSLLLIKYIFS